MEILSLVQNQRDSQMEYIVFDISIIVKTQGKCFLFKICETKIPVFNQKCPCKPYLVNSMQVVSNSTLTTGIWETVKVVPEKQKFLGRPLNYQMSFVSYTRPELELYIVVWKTEKGSELSSDQKLCLQHF
ncbi:unnamed protein product [Acanthoscelides obtectus]|uniref:Uncharacterized protein n=1 Tax=Acanthoscelides obtectus TaxID=200917 RepID=A0A9P0LIE7_ACAOB|nr:unnamed protein product [Acanthoscelides obtectus]CAK1624447.1 hypothetical protein AOBTE_LOCUS2575 [Acanthoscelides obtectus]